MKCLGFRFWSQGREESPPRAYFKKQKYKLKAPTKKQQNNKRENIFPLDSVTPLAWDVLFNVLILLFLIIKI